MAPLLIAAVVFTRDVTSARRARFPAEGDLLYLPQPRALKAMSLGHTEALADLVFLRTLIYFGSQVTGARDYRWLDKYLDTIVALDPHFKLPYRWAGVATMYDGRAITNDSVKLSNHFLELGVARFPDDWELPFMLGCNYLFELKTEDPSQRAEWDRRGTEYIRRAALLGGSPPWVALLAATMLKREGHEELAIRHLEEVYLTTQDERTRDEVRKRLLGFQAQLNIEKYERARAAFEAARMKDLPYVSPDLFAVIGPRPIPRLDLAHLAYDAVLDTDPLVTD